MSGFFMDSDAFTEELQQELARAGRDVIESLGNAQIENIKSRVSQGMGLDDSPMPAYSNATRTLRAKRGLPVNRRTLSASGHMLRSMQLELLEDGDNVAALIGFDNSEAASKAADNQSRAEWFGISPEDEQRLYDLADSLLADMSEG